MHSTLIRYSTGLVALAMLAVMSGTAHAKNEKITICHAPPGNPDNAHTLTISENAWPAHRSHGDSQGSCPEPPPGNGGGGGNSGGGTSPGSDGFAVLLCDSRPDSKGRRIAVSNVGRVMVQEAECQ